MKNLRPTFVLAGFLLAAALAAEARAAAPQVDFNGDGYDDVATGSPYATVDGVDYAGTVTVILGNNAGTQLLKYDQLIVGASQPAQETKYDYFGYAVAAGDFNGDGYTDLAIGVPRYNTIPAMAGVVIVAYGYQWGLKIKQSLCPCPLAPQSFTMYGPIETNNRYGFALAAGDFKLDGYADLAVGAPNRNNGSLVDAGGVHMLHGGPNKLTATTQILSAYSQAHAQFGYSLAAGNFGKTAATDLAVGIPFRDNEFVNSGAVAVYYGSLSGLSTTTTADGGGGRFFAMESDTLDPERGSDYFGWALAAGDFGTGGNSAGFDDLAIGIPQREFGSYNDAGAVIVLYGGSAGLTTNGAIQLQLWYLGINPTAYENFGQALVAGNFGGDNQDDLAIGIPRHPVAGLSSAGAVSVVFGTPSGLGLAGNLMLDMGSIAQSNAFVGAALSAGQFGGDGFTDVVIGIPRWNVSTALGDAGAISIRYGTAAGPPSSASDQFWTAVTPVQGAQFGFSLTR